MDHIVSFPSAPIGAKPAYSKRRVVLMCAMATGWLPWGVEWKREVPLCSNPPRYILCCGHSYRAREIQILADYGLVQAGEPDKFGRPTLSITERGLGWLAHYW